MKQPSIDRNALLARAERLGWPTVAVMGFGISTEAQWRKAVRGSFPVELESLARQLEQYEAERPVRTEPAAVYAALPMLDDEEIRQVEAERVTRMEVAAEERARRLREEETRRLAKQGIE